MFRTILIDPPWNERGGGKIKRGADRHYPLIKARDLPEVILGSGYFCPDENAHLWLWVTNNRLPQGLEPIQTLGFRYVTNAVWVKPSIGIGQYLRGMHELLLFSVRGRLPYRSRSTPSVVFGPKRAHSQKPEESYALIEAVSPGPRVELFARQEREGWTTWGNEV